MGRLKMKFFDLSAKQATIRALFCMIALASIPTIIRSPVIAVLAFSILTIGAHTMPVRAQDQHLQFDGSSSYATSKKLSLAEPRHFARLDAENTQQAVLQVAPAATRADRSAGKWHGAGYTQEGTCPQFEIFISVVEDKIQGEAVLPDQTYKIEGNLGKDGVFVGQVEFFSIAFAELKGDMGPSSGQGQWHTFKGPKCAGTFEVTKL
jgi:hypothetical protein